MLERRRLDPLRAGAMRLLRSRALLLGATVTWVGFVGAWLLVLLIYETTPAAAPSPGSVWPEGAALERNPDGPTLLVFAHPRCPCTRATFEELGRALASRPDDLRVHVILYRPEDAPDEWAHTDLWRSARALPAVEIHIDPGGVESLRFRAGTSGQVLLFDREGTLVFEGGITPSRGHAGSNRGRAALMRLWSGAESTVRSNPVFGCQLTSSKACTQPNPEASTAP